jgi:hypothetical protein
VTTKVDSKNFELLTKWYLRFNGYFTVDNFIIHAGDDNQRISNGTVGNYTDVDILGIRMPFHIERTGELEIKNDTRLQCVEKIDIVIAECKTGEQNGLNKVWSKGNFQAMEYLLKFCGVFKEDKQIEVVAERLLNDFKYEDDKLRIRFIIFAQKSPSKELIDKGLTFISCSEIINFLTKERGGCWVASDIGLKSIHDPWDKLIKSIFNVANDNTIPFDQKENKIYGLLNNR